MNKLSSRTSLEHTKLSIVLVHQPYLAQFVGKVIISIRDCLTQAQSFRLLHVAGAR